jgi:8-oxo-dGTP diphosphatase
MAKDNFCFCPLCRSPLTEQKLEDRRRSVCPACGWIHYLNPAPCAAALVFSREGGILLVRRGVEPGLGLWGLPSGFIEIEETPEQACLRELEEETGLRGEIAGLLGVYAQESSVYVNVLIVGYHVLASGEPRPGSDSLEAVYFDRGSLPEVAFPSHRDMIRDGFSLRNAGEGAV